MPKTTMRKTKKLAICAVFAACSVVLLFAAAVFDVLDLTIVAVCSLLVVVVHIEIGGGYDWLLYGAVTVLAALLLPSKMPAHLYGVFGGVYPIAKAYFERLPRPFAWLLKFASFNAAFVLCMLVARYLLFPGVDDYKFTVPVVLLGNAAFFCYDYATTCLIRLYVMKLRRQFRLDRFFR